MTTSSAVTLLSAHQLEMRETVLPPLADGMVRLRFGAGGICGSDLHYYSHGRAGPFVVKEPLILGHEISGEIVEISGRPPGIKVGDRVAVNPSRWCHRCKFCQAGQLNLCENIFFMGSASKRPHMQGGFATYFDAIPEQCHVVSSSTSFQAAALAEPLAVCLHAVARAGDVTGKSAMIIGAGPIGLLTMLCLRRAGVGSVSLVDVAPATLAHAKRLGADEVIDSSVTPLDAYIAGGGVRPAVIFEATGVPAVLSASLATVETGGTVVQIGNIPGGDQTVQISLVMAREIDLRGSFRFGNEFSEAVRIIENKELDVLSIVTGEQPLADSLSAFDVARDRNKHLKIVLTR